MTRKSITAILLLSPLIACATVHPTDGPSLRDLNLHSPRYINRIVAIEGMGSAQPGQRDIWDTLAARDHDFSRGRALHCVRLIGADAVPLEVINGDGLRVLGTYILEAERVRRGLECPGRGAIVIQRIEPSQFDDSRR